MPTHTNRETTSILQTLRNLRNELHEYGPVDEAGKLSTERFNIGPLRTDDARAVAELHKILYTVSRQNSALADALTLRPNNAQSHRYNMAWANFQSRFQLLTNPVVNIAGLIDRFTELSLIFNDILRKLDSNISPNSVLGSVTSYAVPVLSGLAVTGTAAYYLPVFVTQSAFDAVLDQLAVFLRHPAGAVIGLAGVRRIARGVRDTVGKAGYRQIPAIRRFGVRPRTRVEMMESALAGSVAVAGTNQQIHSLSDTPLPLPVLLPIQPTGPRIGGKRKVANSPRTAAANAAVKRHKPNDV